MICYIKVSNHLAMTNRQGPVQIYFINDNISTAGAGKFELVSILDEDHMRFISGLCEIEKL